MVEQRGVLSPLCQRGISHSFRFTNPMRLVKGPREQVIAIDIATASNLALRFPQHAGYVAVMIEEKETPGTVYRPRLTERAHRHGIGERLRLCRVTERSVRVTHR